MKKYDIENNIRFLGFQPHNKLLMEAYKHHIFISPSICSSNGDLEGGSPVTITEMSASGMPILSTKHCDIPEVVINEKSSFLVPERDIDALAEKLEYLIEHPEIWPDMGKAGRKFIEERYDINKLNKRLVEIYRALHTNNVNELERPKRY